MADMPVVCVETRQMKALMTAQQFSKTDRKRCARDWADDAGRLVQAGAREDAGCPGTADAADHSRKLLQRKLLDVESDLRGTLRNFGSKVGVNEFCLEASV